MQTPSNAWCGLSSAAAEGSVADLPSALLAHVGALVVGATASVVARGPDGAWQVASASSEAARELTAVQLATGEGPCIDSLVRAAPVLAPDLSLRSRWPGLAGLALAQGVRAILAVPLPGGRAALGALGVFAADATGIEGCARHLEALAELAGVALVQRRATAETRARVGELERALAARIPVEQAKGMVSERAGVDMSTAFGYLLRSARARGWSLEALADVVTSGTIDLDEVIGHRGAPAAPGARWDPPLGAVRAASS